MSFDPAGNRKSIWYRRDQDGLKPTARSLPQTLEGGALTSSVFALSLCFRKYIHCFNRSAGIVQAK